jgi:hypothetical protein
MTCRESPLAFWLAAVTASLAALSGCASSGGTANQRSSASDCGSGTPDPISVGTLIRVFAKHGIALRRTDGCVDPKAAATVANDPLHVTPKRQREALAEHGAINCGLYEASIGSRVAELTFGEGRKGATYSVLNVSCDIYPTSPARYRAQERAVKEIVLVLSKLKSA